MADSDEEDLWADFDNEETETTLSVSENLRDQVNHAVAPVHAGDVDEGKLTWEAPQMPGLQNSKTVAEAKASHWYVEETPATPSASPFPTGVAASMSAAPVMPAAAPALANLNLLMPAADAAHGAAPLAVLPAANLPPATAAPAFDWSGFGNGGALPPVGSLWG